MSTCLQVIIWLWVYVMVEGSVEKSLFDLEGNVIKFAVTFPCLPEEFQTDWKYYILPALNTWKS